MIYTMTPTETSNVSLNASPEATTTLSTSGRVKWFNNKAGYGFITVSDGEHSGSDVFVHHSAIIVEQEQYRYLVQGEYVTFQLCQVEDANHQWQAGTVQGINSGKLMCETRLESRETRMSRGPGNEGDRPQPRRDNTSFREDNPRHDRVRTRGQGPRDGDEWMLIRRRPSQRSTNQESASQPTDVLRGRQSRPPSGDRPGNQM
jgi:cold shock CspA family protein